jgi:SAM-dependent methyltransferase
MVYRPDVFDATDMNAAMSIILTPEEGTSTAERWEYETPFLVDEIGRQLGIRGSDCVIDFGCGIGRLARGLIERFGCRVVGVDLSERMRELARRYVAPERFEAWSPEELDRNTASGFRADKAFSCWVLQHCLKPDRELARIEAALAPEGRFLVVNQRRRAVPSNVGWVDDGIEVERLLEARFRVVARSAIPEVVSTPEIAAESYILLLEKSPPLTAP